MAIREVGRGGLLRVRNILATVMVAALTLVLSAAAHAATITVNSLADAGAPGICVLRDAITAANTKTAANGCAAGTGSDTINFSVTGTITLGSTLPQITDSLLTINGPASPGITISGGGKVQVMSVLDTDLTLNHLTIAHGATDSDNGGGGILNNGSLTVTNSIFSGNSAEFGGGAIVNSGMYGLTITNSTFSGNSATNSGGAILNAGTLTVVNSTFSGNSTEFSGDVIENASLIGAAISITNSTFSGNSIDGGGVIENGEAGLVNITNSTFSGNNGWAIGNGGEGATLIVTNSTFAGNSGGNISDSSTLGGSILKSTILATGGGGNCSGTIGDAGYNISDDSTCNFSATGSRNDTNPMLDPAGLHNNGGPTRTIALLSGSPAIDAIPLASCTDQDEPHNPIITDQRLFPRPDDAEADCDIGAYEFHDTAFTLIPFSHFGGRLRNGVDSDVFNLSGGFKLGAGGSIDPATQPVAFSIGIPVEFGANNYSIRLPAGSFAKYSSGYLYQKTVNGIFLRLFIKFTSTPGKYVLLADLHDNDLFIEIPVVTLIIGQNGGSAPMTAKFD